MCYWYESMGLIIKRKTTAVMGSNEVGQQWKNFQFSCEEVPILPIFGLIFFLSIVDNVQASFIEPLAWSRFS